MHIRSTQPAPTGTQTTYQSCVMPLSTTPTGISKVQQSTVRNPLAPRVLEHSSLQDGLCAWLTTTRSILGG